MVGLVPRPSTSLPGDTPVVHGQDAAVQIDESEGPDTFLVTDIKELWGRHRGEGTYGPKPMSQASGVSGERAASPLTTRQHSQGTRIHTHSWLGDSPLHMQVHGLQGLGAVLESCGDLPIFWSVDAIATRFMLCRHAMSTTHICWWWSGWIW